MAAIDSKFGNMITKFKKGYFDQQDTIDFIDKIRRSHVNRDFTIFIDNASIHVGVEIRAHLKKHKVNAIKNI